MIQNYANQVLKTKNRLQWQRIAELQEEASRARLQLSKVKFELKLQKETNAKLENQLLEKFATPLRPTSPSPSVSSSSTPPKPPPGPVDIHKILVDFDQLPNLGFHEMNKRREFISAFKRQLEQWNTHLFDIVHNGQLFANSIQKLAEVVSGTIDFVQDFPEVVHEFLTLSQILNHISGIHKTGVLSIQEAFTAGFEELQTQKLGLSSQRLSRLLDLYHDYGQSLLATSQKKGKDAKQGKVQAAESMPAHLEKMLGQAKREYLEAVNQENQAIHIELIDKIHALYFSFHTLYAQTLKNIARFQGHIEISSQKNAARNIETTRKLKELRAQPQRSLSDTQSPEGMLLFQKKKAADFKLKFFWVHKKQLWYGKLRKKQGRVQIEKRQALMTLFLSNAKPVSGGQPNLFEIISPETKQNYRFQCASDHDLKNWLKRLHQCCQKFLEEYSPSSRPSYKRSNSSDFGGFAVRSAVSPEPFRTISGLTDIQESKSAVIPYTLPGATLADQFEGSLACADCGAKKPLWMSSTFLVPLCLNCSSFHRQMGPKVSRVKSIKLDKLPRSLIETAISLHSQGVYKILEEILPPDRSLQSMERQGLKQQFYCQKYESKSFIKPGRAVALTDYLRAIKVRSLGNFYRLIALDPLSLAGAKVKIEDGESTLLHACAKQGFVQGIVILVFLGGASLHTLDHKHCTPSQVALVNNQVQVLETISALLR